MGMNLKKLLITFALGSTLALGFLSKPKASEWDTETKALYWSGVALITADWAQTRDIASRVRPDGSKVFRELNPLLPEYPSLNQVNRHFITGLVVHYALAEVIPQPYKSYFLAGTIVVQSGFVAHNINAGVRFNIRF
jgi:hypothetical protein